jgi:cytochrome P450
VGADRFERYRDRDPVHWHAPSDAWLITRYDDVVKLLADPRLAARTLGDRIDTLPGLSPEERSELAAFYGGWLSLTDGPVHAGLRRLIAPILAPSKVAPWAPVFREFAEGQAHGARWDQIDDTFARPYAARVVGAVLGLTPGEFPEALRATGRLLRLLGVGNPSVLHAREAYEALAVVSALGRRLVDRAGTPMPLLHGCTLPDEVRGATLVQLIGGGYDPLARCLTSYATVGAPVAEGAGDPVDEVLRLHPPFELLPRIATESVRVGDRVLPGGSRVLLAIGSANQDESQGMSSAPGLAEQPPVHVSFGGGRHRCPAASLGRSAVSAGVAVLSRCSTRS